MMRGVKIFRIGLVLGGALALLILAVIVLAALERMSPYDFLRGYAEGRSSALDAYAGRRLSPAEQGAITFRYSDFGALNTDTLETHATPWRLAAAALALREVELKGGELSIERVKQAMLRFGFLYPGTIGNWPQGLDAPEAQLAAPMGLSLGLVSRKVPSIKLTAANLSCASCHAGATYDAAGRPITSTAWLGAPNTSLNLEAYVLALYDAFNAAKADEDRLLNAVRTLFPDTTDAEMTTIEDFVMPRVRSRIGQLAKAGDRPLPFVNGAPGITNGVAALRMQLGAAPADAYATQRGFTSIPDLGNRGLRSALLYDGAYAPAGAPPHRAIKPADLSSEHIEALAEITSFFTVPSMGVHPDRAERSIPDAISVFDFLDGYSAPRLPAPVDAALAAQGRELYANRCSSCHGIYDDGLERPMLVEFPNWIGPYDTDPARAQAFDAETIKAIGKSPYGKRILARVTGQYAAPPLSGIWLSAPYLHNGSVPTLWHLMTPSERPATFMVGGHKLDLKQVGIAGHIGASGAYVYPPGYEPWSEPMMINTADTGYGNQGHTAEFSDFTDSEKWALIEYLKLL